MGNDGISHGGRRNGNKRHNRETGNGRGGSKETYRGQGKGYPDGGHNGRGGMENGEETAEWSGYDEEGTGYDGDDGSFGEGERGGGSQGGRLTDGSQKSHEEEEEMHVGQALSDQHKLYNDLFKKYNRRARPIISHEDVIKVQFEIALFNVLSLDSKNGVMITNSELIMKWNDPYLRWDPRYYNDTTSLRVPYQDVWYPDIILYNTADTSYENSLIRTNVIIEHTGNCKLISHAVFTSVCNIDIQWFPFDQQTCPMIFASWTADVTQMVLVQGSSDITRYSPNHEFFMENFYSKAYEDFDPCCDKPFSMISIHIQLQRRVKFALFFFIVPGVLINVCALLVFSLPAETGEKMGLGVNALLAMIVFLMAMTENLPPTETLPLAGIYYGVCLVVVTINIAFSVYVLNLSYSGDRGYEVPIWMRIVTLFSAKVVFMKVPRFIEELWDLDENQKISKDKVRPFTANFDPTNNISAIKHCPNVNAGDSEVIKAIPSCLSAGDRPTTTENANASANTNTNSKSNTNANTTSAEHKLFGVLFSNYNKHIRPIRKHGDVTYVFFELSLFDVLMLDTKNQFIRTNTEIIMKWKDDYLSWEPADYEDTRVIRIPYKNIWYPDIIMMNTNDADYEGLILNSNAIVFHTGEVELVSHGIFNAICSLDIQYYPFDQQLCHLTFSSWTYDKNEIILLPGPADLSKFTQNPMFFLEDFYSEYMEVHNPCCKYPMSTIVFYIQIQRRTIFSLFFFIMPGILINICALMVFSLPSETGEKVGLGINSMLAMMVFLMAMTEKLPPTEKLPLAGVYYGACITMIALNITFSVGVLNLNVMGMRGYKVPQNLRIVTLFVAKMFVVRIPTVVRERWCLDKLRGYLSSPEHIRAHSSSPEHLSAHSSSPEHLTAHYSSPEKVSAQSSSPEHLSAQLSSPEHLTEHLSAQSNSPENFSPEHLCAHSSYPECLSAHSSSPENLSSLTNSTEHLSAQPSSPEHLSAHSNSTGNLSDPSSSPFHEHLSDYSSSLEHLSAHSSSSEHLSAQSSSPEHLSAHQSSLKHLRAYSSSPEYMGAHSSSLEHLSAHSCSPEHLSAYSSSLSSGVLTEVPLIPLNTCAHSSSPEHLSAHSSSPECLSPHTSSPEYLSPYTSSPEHLSAQPSSSENLTAQSSSPENLRAHSSSTEHVSAHSNSPENLSAHYSSPEHLSAQSGSPEHLSAHSSSPELLTAHSSSPVHLSAQSSSPEHLSTHSSSLEHLSAHSCSLKHLCLHSRFPLHLSAQPNSPEPLNDQSSSPDSTELLSAHSSSPEHLIAHSSSSEHLSSHSSSPDHLKAHLSFPEDLSPLSSSPDHLSSYSSSPEHLSAHSSSPEDLYTLSSSPKNLSSPEHLSAHSSSPEHLIAHSSSPEHLISHSSSPEHLIAHLSSSEHLSAHLCSPEHLSTLSSSPEHLMAHSSSPEHSHSEHLPSKHKNRVDPSGVKKSFLASLQERGAVTQTKVEPFEEVRDTGGSLVKVFTVEPAPPPSQPQPHSPTPPQPPKFFEEEKDFDYDTLQDPFQKRALMALETMSNVLTRKAKASLKHQEVKDLIEEWKFISRVTDRTLFVTFTLACLFFNVIILTSSPFREKFDYCPLEEGCDDMTFDEIKQITLLSATNAHVTGEDVGMGGHSWH
ncbi:uncharacterized protein [Macrobrachium rosenbergii]|uniref:uncharacterized protein n=1 Tax=Macrobrachium rosenbergii TaxID=79674 RepID=UPI0034D5617B